jgi:hypothetical protein
MASNFRVFDPTIDPNEPNINLNLVNGIPQYENMYIHAELTAISRGRTILSIDVDTDVRNIDKSGYNDGRLVSFLGQNQDIDDASQFNKFTTNYYDSNTNSMKIFEGFGIGSINVLVNSSFIPQISIEFIDIKGRAFFNNEYSPYRILFNFPPPIFHLTLKGYYGKATTYQMHLVKYNSQFMSNTGNYHIDAKFIAITYAPLTDIPFRYILQAPFMDENNRNESLSEDILKPPSNTLDLILKLQRLYDESQKKIKNDFDFINFESSQKKLQNYNNIYSILNAFSNDKILNQHATPKLFTYDTTQNSNSFGSVEKLITFNQYENYLRTLGSELPLEIPKKIYIGYLFQIGSEENLTSENIDKSLINYKEFIISRTSSLFTNLDRSDISDPKVIRISNGGGIIEGIDIVGFNGINVTNYFTKLYNEKIKSNILKADSMTNLNDTINNMVQENLGMIPTIYNVFEILLRDVDTFFNVLKKCTEDSENHHETYYNKILSNPTYRDTQSKIYSFPLVIEQKTHCNQKTEIKRAPIELSNSLDEPFPELKLVQRFIDSFILTKRIEAQTRLKDEKNAQGDHKWIPFTPADTKIISSVNSPYFDIDSSGISSGSINMSNDPKLNQIFKILLNRFYVLSQNSLAYSFYGYTPPVNDDKYFLYDNSTKNNNSYIEFFAQSEAKNLANSIINENQAMLLKEFSLRNKTNANLRNNNGFYEYLRNNINNEFSNTNNTIDISGIQFNKNKLGSGSDYVGLSFIDITSIEERNGTSNDEFGRFLEENKTKLIDRLFSFKDIRTIEEVFKFSQENFILRKDTVSVQNNFLSATPNSTKFLCLYRIVKKEGNEISLTDVDDPNNTIKVLNRTTAIDELSEQGNLYFFSNNIEYTRNLKAKKWSYENIYNIWSNNLGDFDTQMYDEIINPQTHNRKLSALMILSNFGYSLGVFNYYPFFLNKDFFSTPSVIEIPNYVKLYLGLLVGIEKNDTFWNEIYDFFTTGGGSEIKTGGLFIFGDIYDVNNNLSERDKFLLQTEFENWYGSSFDNISNKLNKLYLEVNSEEGRKRKLYEDKLEGDYSGIIQDLINRIGLVCYNEITFRLNDDVLDSNFKINSENIQNTYTPLSQLINNNRTSQTTDTFFISFFNELENEIENRIDELDNERQEFKMSTDDEDIMTQTYYSFKNINDKWLAGLNKNIDGYPFKTDPKSGLISQFSFVDRAMNPIGDTIVDLKNLIDAKDSPDLSIFTVISQLLSLNGFEFFPLQNFLKFTEDEWKKSFRINTDIIQKQYPVFVCMYLGGSASYPTGLEKYAPFTDDGIVSLEDSNASEFFSDPCEITDSRKDNQLNYREINGDMYNNIKAFKVRYGEQNQSMFYDFEVDSKEYPETNESIQILSRIAGDNRENSPVPKAQNLYNLYENRAYKATITGLGNVMIQPTQYFQLENVPIFNGVYMILSVEHIITPNKMVTKFSGTKIPKYPLPRVLNAASVYGFEGGMSVETNPSDVTLNEVIVGVGTSGNPNQAKYNSMYTLRIGV